MCSRTSARGVYLRRSGRGLAEKLPVGASPGMLELLVTKLYQSSALSHCESLHPRTPQPQCSTACAVVATDDAPQRTPKHAIPAGQHAGQQPRSTSAVENVRLERYSRVPCHVAGSRKMLRQCAARCCRDIRPGCSTVVPGARSTAHCLMRMAVFMAVETLADANVVASKACSCGCAAPRGRLRSDSSLSL